MKLDTQRRDAAIWFNTTIASAKHFFLPAMVYRDNFLVILQKRAINYLMVSRWIQFQMDAEEEKKVLRLHATVHFFTEILFGLILFLICILLVVVIVCLSSRLGLDYLEFKALQ
jgi:hypothetical protein